MTEKEEKAVMDKLEAKSRKLGQALRENLRKQVSTVFTQKPKRVAG